MRAVTCTNAELEVVERPEPDPGRGQVRIEVLRCGICGSDLHARHGLDAWAEVALPLLRGSGGVDAIGLSAHAPGAYADQLLVEESLMMPVPNGLDPEVAALTEPMAVAWHAVRRGEVGKRTVAIVIGCGPVGLAVILVLKAKGVCTVVASDFSAGRRTLASACGADVIVDPSEASPLTAAD